MPFYFQIVYFDSKSRVRSPLVNCFSGAIFMIHTKYCIYFVFLFFFGNVAQSQHSRITTFYKSFSDKASAVTYTLSGGRFGDNLISYCHAKWFSYKHAIPLAYIPFNYSNMLKLHQQEMPLSAFSLGYFKQRITLQRYAPDMIIEPNTLYVLPNFPEAELDRDKDKTDNFKQFVVDWNDPVFKKSLKEAIAPAYECSCLSLPLDMLTLAVHVRKNSNGFDGPLWYHMKEFDYVQGHINPVSGSPAKFVPDRFYVDNIKKLSEMLGHKPLYVFIFTDDQNPLKIMNDLKRQVNLPNLQFDCRRGRHSHTMHVLEDFFSMINFDFLIRADSYFSLACAKIANFKIEISPVLADLENNLRVLHSEYVIKNVRLAR